MSPELQKIIDRIGKMLRLAADPAAADGERDNALRMAHRLLTKYNLDMSQINGTGARGYAPEARYHHRQMSYAKDWAVGIAQACARLNYCDMLFSKKVWDPMRGDYSTKWEYVFVGTQANAVTSGLFAEEFVNATYKEYSRKKKEGRAVARSWATGVMSRLWERVNAIIREDMQDEKIEIIRRIESDATAEHFKAIAVKEAKPRRKTAAVELYAYMEGRKHGDTFNLNRRIA